MVTFQRRHAHELLRTSLHEAGHVVAAHMLGIDVSRAPVATSNNALGSCRMFTPFWALPGFADERHKQLVDNYLVVACAGWGAEMIIYGDAEQDASADDMRMFRETLMDSPVALVQRRNRKHVDLFLQSLQERRCVAAAELLEPHQGLLYGVARLLMRKQAVDAAEIHALLDRMLIEGE
jgi:ATP-dependent Zn protease